MSMGTQANSQAITDQEFSDLMSVNGLEKGQKSVAVAVSGGADSMALSLLVANWGKAIYLSFDHGLRDSSADELRQVSKWFEKKGLKHVVLSWQGEKPSTGIQQAARDARYLAMEKWCKANGVDYLLLAHHEGDQAETFLMRLARGSGVDGLSAMAAKSPPFFVNGGPEYVRPLLKVSKSRLVATLNEMSHDWIEDPSNQNLAFTRVQARNLLEEQPLEGLNNKRMAATAERMKRVKRVLDRLTSEVIESAIDHNQLFEKLGFCSLKIEVLKSADDEIALRALSRLLTHFGGNIYPPRMLPVERLLGEILREGFTGATLAGCHISVDAGNKGRVFVGREENAIDHQLAINPGEEVLWDKRFFVKLGDNQPPLWVKKLSKENWLSLSKESSEISDLGIPKHLLTTLPAFFLNKDDGLDKLLSIPSIEFGKSGLDGLKVDFMPKQALRS